ncbi:transcription antitermination factor NusB [Demequina activiva]|uniref:Transcription antitermination protein NusB n=1 Tax=Demequina activiva TaxID=1582364 RepID=A0A919UG97_9MICO|nr:transcription antitermination factor NusB [Demequina activiva]GIG54612.1 N utilization substance protein B [Demequina activiva]
MGARTKARKRALDVLFEAEQRGDNVLAVLDRRLLESGRETPLPPYSAQIVRGVVSQWRELNALIEDASPDWPMKRMPAVDRNLLRLAAWEILSNEEVSVAVAIDEAVELARDLSTDDSPRFVNGVLGRIARDAPNIAAAEAPAESGDEEAGPQVG